MTTSNYKKQEDDWDEEESITKHMFSIHDSRLIMASTCSNTSPRGKKLLSLVIIRFWCILTYILFWWLKLVLNTDTYQFIPWFILCICLYKCAWQVMVMEIVDSYISAWFKSESIISISNSIGISYELLDYITDIRQESTRKL